MILSEKTQANKYFEEVVKKLKNVKIKSVFTLSSPSWSSDDGYRRYFEDSEIYVLFENDMCLVIEYYFLDLLNVELKMLSPKKKEEYKKLYIKDFFNASNDICDHITYKKVRNESCSLEYDYMEKVELRSVTGEYEKWIDGNVDFVNATEEAFDEIRITMNNKNSFVICAADAYLDGYVLVWSEDCINHVVEYGDIT